MAKYFLKRTLFERLTGTPENNPTVSIQTIDRYRKLFKTLQKKAQLYLEEKKKIKKKLEEIEYYEFYEYLEFAILTKQLSFSSIKGFRSTLLFHIYEEADRAFTAGQSITEYNQIYEKVKDIIAKDGFAHSNNTNSPSLKFFDKDFFNYCIGYLKSKLTPSKTEIMLKHFLEANIHLGLRPHEWINARTASYLNPDNKNGHSNMLIVENSKNSNGRANGKVRELLLDGLNRDTLISISTLINLLNYDVVTGINKNTNLEKSSQKVIKKSILNMTRCLNKLEKNYISINPEKENIVKNTVLYSTRHQAIANAKAAQVDDIMIAAIFGHISSTTSKKYYGRKSNGWKKDIKHSHIVRATQESIKPILDHRKYKDTTYRPSVNTNLLSNHFE